MKKILMIILCVGISQFGYAQNQKLADFLLSNNIMISCNADFSVCVNPDLNLLYRAIDNNVKLNIQYNIQKKGSTEEKAFPAICAAIFAHISTNTVKDTDKLVESFDYQYQEAMASYLKVFDEYEGKFVGFSSKIVSEGKDKFVSSYCEFRDKVNYSNPEI
ncbi:hypothetical protein GCM10023338_20520 [Wohlfahrtiimonas larvae]|uniref:Uncharacterized protein n=3 Tax=Wohlfahrtiimonas larvae TaxID=1157986 RepID=A0ABP9MVB7_9GAMM